MPYKDPDVLEQAAHYIRLQSRAGRVSASMARCLEIAAKASVPPNTPMAARKNDTGTVYLYRAIGDAEWGGLSAEAFKAEVDKLGNVSTLVVRINSIGGSVFDGLAIMNIIASHPAKDKVVYVDALAASAASFIAMAGTKIVMAPDAMMMIHEPHSLAQGGAADLRKMADLLEKTRDTLINIYNRRTGMAKEEVAALLAAETWLTAEDAVAKHFADEILNVEPAPRATLDKGTLKLAAAHKNTARTLSDADVAIATMSMYLLKSKT